MLNSLEYYITLIWVLQDAGARILSFSQGLSLTCHLETNLPELILPKCQEQGETLQVATLCLNFLCNLKCFQKTIWERKTKKCHQDIAGSTVPNVRRCRACRIDVRSGSNNPCFFQVSTLLRGRVQFPFFRFCAFFLSFVIVNRVGGCGGVWGGKGGC